MAEQKEIPLYTKIGARLTIILILILTVIILKNCVSAFLYGTSTKEEDIKQYYEIGYRDGTQQAKGAHPQKTSEIKNSLLKKAYRQGFRDGWDAERSGSEKEESKQWHGNEERSMKENYQLPQPRDDTEKIGQ